MILSIIFFYEALKMLFKVLIFLFCLTTVNAANKGATIHNLGSSRTVPFKFVSQYELSAAAPHRRLELLRIKTKEDFANFVRSLNTDERNILAEKIMQGDWKAKPAIEIFEILSDDINFASRCKAILARNSSDLSEKLSQNPQTVLEQIKHHKESVERRSKIDDIIERIKLYQAEFKRLVDKKIEYVNLKDTDKSSFDFEGFANIQELGWFSDSVYNKCEALKNELGSLLDTQTYYVHSDQRVYASQLRSKSESEIAKQRKNDYEELIKASDTLTAQLLPIYRTHPLAHFLCSGVTNKQKILKAIQGFDSIDAQRIIEGCGWQTDLVNIAENLKTKTQIKLALEDSALSADGFLDIFPKIVDALKAGDKSYIGFFKKLEEKLNENFENVLIALRQREEKDALCADFLSLFFCQQQQTLAHIDLFVKDPTIAGLSKDKITEKVNQNFAIGVLQELSEHYAKRMTAGYVMPSFLGNDEEDAKEPKEPITITAQLRSGDVTFKTYLMDREPKTILIDFYGGKSISAKEKTETEQDPIQPLSNSMMVVSPLLGDELFDVSQQDQLTPVNFSTTHAMLLKRMSDFVKHLRETHPTANIYLYGASFGGFFATSYAYHQSGGSYNEWAQAGINQAFNTQEISKVDGIICHAPALSFMQKIMRVGSDLSCIAVPACMHFNKDDERVKLEEQMPFVNQFNEHLRNVVVSPFGAQPFCGDDNDNSDFEYTKTIRGHFNNRWSQQEFDEQILGFLGDK